MDFPPCCPAGRVANGCAETVYRQRVEGFFRLQKDWTGWTVKDGHLIGPRGMRFTPATLAIAWRHLTETPATPADPPATCTDRSTSSAYKR